MDEYFADLEHFMDSYREGLITQAEALGAIFEATANRREAYRRTIVNEVENMQAELKSLGF